MVWARLDDAILDNPKIAAAGVLGFALHVAAITWCCRNLTDGFIPRRRAACLLDFASLPSEVLEATGDHPRALEDDYLGAASELGSPAADPVIDRLLDAGLWTTDEAKDGYWLKDFLQYNPSREKVLAERSRGAERKRDSRGRIESASASPESAPRQARDSARTPHGLRIGLASASDGPVPDPDPQRGETPLPPVSEPTDEPPSEIRLRAAHESDPMGDDELAGAWADGVTAGSGHRMAKPSGGQRRQLVDLAHTHGPNRAGIAGFNALRAWIRERGEAFGEAYSSRTRSVFAFGDWLNSGNASPPILIADVPDEAPLPRVDATEARLAGEEAQRVLGETWARLGGR